MSRANELVTATPRVYDERFIEEQLAAMLDKGWGVKEIAGWFARVGYEDAKYDVLFKSHPYPERGDIIRVLASCTCWMRKGLAEGAYSECVGGNEVVIRCIENAEAIIKHLEGE